MKCFNGASNPERTACTCNDGFTLSGTECTAPTDSKFFVAITVKLPYTVDSFGKTEQDKYKQAVANVANTSPLNVEIVSIEPARRREGNINVRAFLFTVSVSSTHPPFALNLSSICVCLPLSVSIYYHLKAE